MKSTARLGCIVLGTCAWIWGAIACNDPDTEVKPALDAGADATSNVDAAHQTDGATPDAGAVPVTIRFKAKVGAQDFKCGTAYPDQGSTNETVEPRDLRLFVQDVQLLDEQGTAHPVTIDERSPWQAAHVALLDFEDGTGACTNGNANLNDRITGKVDPGTYTGIVFTNGVPEEINHADPATSPPPLTAGGMTWGWLLGHLFIKAEMTSTGDAGVGLGLLHLGSVGCTNSADGGQSNPNQGPTMPCKQPNRNQVRLTGFSPETSAIVLDVGTIFAGVDLTANSMCHSMGASCPTMFESVGLDYTDGGARLSTHPAFRVE